MAVATGGRDVEARRHVPTEVAVQFVVSGGFGEHVSVPRHGRAKSAKRVFASEGPGHPRSCCLPLVLKTWMPGTSPGMTKRREFRPFTRNLQSAQPDATAFSMARSASRLAVSR